MTLPVYWYSRMVRIWSRCRHAIWIGRTIWNLMSMVFIIPLTSRQLHIRLIGLEVLLHQTQEDMCYRLKISTNCLDKIQGYNDMKFDEGVSSIVLLTLIQLQIWLIGRTIWLYYVFWLESVHEGPDSNDYYLLVTEPSGAVSRWFLWAKALMH